MCDNALATKTPARVLSKASTLNPLTSPLGTKDCKEIDETGFKT